MSIDFRILSLFNPYLRLPGIRHEAKVDRKTR